jgi:hypothetical protein
MNMRSTTIRIINSLGLIATLLAASVDVAFSAEISNRTLFGNQAVQRELQLTDEQQEQIDEILTEIEQQIARGVADAPADTKEPLEASRLEDRIADKVIAKQGPRLMAILDKRQSERYWQIGAQAAGAGVFNNNRVQRVLNLTNEQRTSMAEMSTKMVDEVTKLALDPDLDVATIQQRSTQAQQKHFKDLLAVLTKQQRKDFEQLLGKPFNLELLKSTPKE